MPKLIAICLEDLGAPEDERYLQCVAVEGSEPGLGLGADGSVLWREVSVACELWVSLDSQLMLLRREGAPPVAVSRGGRVLEAPAEKPVILRHGDELALAARRLQLHVHGEAHAVAPPTPLRDRLGRAAAALAVGALVGGVALPAGAGAVAGPDPIEVRAQPPRMAPKPPPKKADDKKKAAKKPSKKKGEDSAR